MGHLLTVVISIKVDTSQVCQKLDNPLETSKKADYTHVSNIACKGLVEPEVPETKASRGI